MARKPVKKTPKPFKLSARSLGELDGVHPDLVAVVSRAIEITEVDFMVLDGLRTLEEQRENVAAGVSQTLKSKHLAQEDGFSHAVDLVPIVGGKARWEWEPCIYVARAVQTVVTDLRLPVVWGGAWARLDVTKADPALLLGEYVAKRHRAGRRPFVDGPHFELAD